ncbi:protocadherin gamma-A5-like [Octopus sinensis]|uniref:Protocadherin gamma-A5-like n=1 Tax=Octopus sinensis TaxID=2607531 RepID=A0A6P7TSL6_9MOLL|nr:protocadherin gamma-A5-like [Octopus sinensis]
MHWWLICLPNLIYSKKFEVIEESGIGFVVGDLKDWTVDDLANTAVVLTRSYAEKGERLFADMLNIDARSGLITTTKNFDREEICPSTTPCELDMQIYIFHGDSVSSTFEAKLLIRDINDHAPQFEHAVYEMEVDKISLMLTAVDRGSPPLNGSITLVINVLDENDNKPTFPTQNYSFFVDQQELAKTNEKIYVGTLEAWDVDIDSKIRYSLDESTPWYYADHFQIDEVNSIHNLQERGDLFLIKSRQVKENPLRTYKLTVIASNVLGSDEMRSTTSVNVNFPVKDKRLILLLRHKILNIQENQQHGQEVAELAVFSPDSLNPGFADCGVDSPYFRLIYASKAGQFIVLTNQIFDYEQTSRVVATITCKYDGLSAQTKFTVDVINVNDNIPKFRRNTYFVNSTENSGVGQYMLTVVADDADPDSRVSYSLDRTDILAIGRESGEIYSKINFDYELQSTYYVKLFATDNGSPPLTGTAFGQVKATDLDSYPNNVLKYTIKNNRRVASYFKINHTSGLIHYNISYFDSLFSLTELEVVVSDVGHLYSTTNVTIYKVVTECGDSTLNCTPTTTPKLLNSSLITPTGIVICVIGTVILLTTVIIFLKKPHLKTIIYFRRNKENDPKFCRAHSNGLIRMKTFELDNPMESVRSSNTHSNGNSVMRNCNRSLKNILYDVEPTGEY